MKKRINGLISLWLAVIMAFSSFAMCAGAADPVQDTAEILIYDQKDLLNEYFPLPLEDFYAKTVTLDVSLNSQDLVADDTDLIGWIVYTQATKDSDSVETTYFYLTLSKDGVLTRSIIDNILNNGYIPVLQPIYNFDLSTYAYTGDEPLEDGSTVYNYTPIDFKMDTPLKDVKSLNDICPEDAIVTGWTVWNTYSCGDYEYTRSAKYNLTPEESISFDDSYDIRDSLLFEPHLLRPYWFTKQPTPQDPSVEVNIPADVADYEWLMQKDYEASVDDSVASTIDAYDLGITSAPNISLSFYDDSTDLWTPVTDGNAYAYLQLHIEKNDQLLVSLPNLPERSVAYLYLMDAKDINTGIFSTSYTGEELTVTAPESGTYILAARVMSVDEDQNSIILTAEQLAANVSLRSRKYTSVSGATSTALPTNAQNGIYICKATFENGIVLTSNPVIVSDKACSPVSGKIIENTGSPSPGVSCTVAIPTDYGMLFVDVDANLEFTTPALPVGEYNAIVFIRNSSLPIEASLVSYFSVDAENTDPVTLYDNPPSSSGFSLSSYITGVGSTRFVIADLLAESISQQTASGSAIISSTGAAVEETVTPDEADAAAIKAVSNNSAFMFFEASVGFNPLEPTNFVPTHPIEETASLLRIYLPFDTENRENLAVYRVHGVDSQGAPTVYTFTKLETYPESSAVADGTFYVGDGYMVLWTKYFSTYAIGYDAKQVVPENIPQYRRDPVAAKTYTIKFDPNGGSDVKDVTVKHGSKLAKPADPTKSSFSFAGWYTDEELTKEYNFNKTVASSFTLYAKWTQDGQEDGEWKNPFNDVKPGDWFYDGVKFLNENDICNGVSANSFGPNLLVTRAMFVTVLWRIEGMPEVSLDTRFKDIESGSYYEKAILWAEKNGIIKGYTPTEVRPDGNILREQICAILHRYAKYKGIDTSGFESYDLSKYPDKALIDGYAVPKMQWALGKGLITGRSATSLAPDGFATRAESAVFIARFMKNIMGK